MRRSFFLRSLVEVACMYLITYLPPALGENHIFMQAILDETRRFNRDCRWIEQEAFRSTGIDFSFRQQRRVFSLAML